MRNVIVVSYIYILIQYLAYYGLSISVPCAIDLGFIGPYDANYEYYFSQGNSSFRPGSFWVEPAHMGHFFNCFLCLCLFENNDVRKIIDEKGRIYRYIFIACMGIILCLSTSAIFIMLLLLLIKAYKIWGVNAIFITVGCFGLCYLFVELEVYNLLGTFGRSIYYSIYKLQHLSENARTGDSFKILNGLNCVENLFGLGIGNGEYLIKRSVGQYANSIVTIVLWSGWLGLGIWFAVFGNIWIGLRGELARRALLLVFIIDWFYSSICFSAHGFVYLVIILYGEVKEPIKTITSKYEDEKRYIG